MFNRKNIAAMNSTMNRVDGNTFYNAISSYKANSTNPNKWMVDVHEKREYNRKGYKCFLSEDGKSGVVVNKRHEVISVFTETKGKKAIERLITHAIANGGRTLDCFMARGEKNLPSMYAKLGAVPVGKMKYDEAYAPDDAKDENGNIINRPKYVVAMTLPLTVNEVGEKYSVSRPINDDVLSNVKTYTDYEKMLKDARSIAARERKNISSQFSRVHNNNVRKSLGIVAG